MRRKPVQREKHEQAAIVQLLRSIGASVYVLGTRRPRGDYHGTCQTPGIPDLYAMLPARKSWAADAVWIEVKSATGRLSPDQSVFASRCYERSIPYVRGGVDAVISWLTASGYLKPDQVPHYRQKGLTHGDDQKPVARGHARAETA